MAKASKPAIGSRHRLDAGNDSILGSALQAHADERDHRASDSPASLEKAGLDPVAGNARTGAKLLPSPSLASFSPLPPTALYDLNGAADQVKEGAASGGAKAGDLIGITAHSTDPNGGQITYKLLSDGSKGGFVIDAKSGVISVKDAANLDFETALNHQYKLMVEARDWDGLSTTKTFLVTLTNVNETPGPIADADGAADTVAENAVAGTVVGIAAKSTDPDAGDAVTYSLTDDAGGRFQIDAASGVVSVKAGAALDFEASASHTIKIQAKDAGGLLSPVQSFTVSLGNVNEAPGPIADANATTNAVAENAAAGTLVGVMAKSTDPDAGDAVTYSLGDDAGGRFQIDAVSGVVSVKAGAVLDHETATSHAITVQAKDGTGRLSPLQSFTIAVTKVNEAPGPIADANAATNAIAENAAAGTLVGIAVKSVDPDAGDTITYSLTDDAGGRFQINAVTGVVSVKAGAVLDYETATSHAITVKATDAGGLSSSQSYAIAVINVNEPVDLANLPAADGFRIDGAAADDFSGLSVAASGDINGDGFADLIVGARGADPNGRSSAGSSYVLFGKSSGFSDIDLAALPAADGFRIDGAAAGDWSGHSVAAAGDVNGDGFADLIVGAPLAGPNGKLSAGSSYVIFGKSSGFATIDLAGQPAAAGFRIDGMGINDFSGYSVAAAGDVNGDGCGDLIIGAWGADPNGKINAGSSYVIFGKSGGSANVDLAALPAAAGFRLDGASGNAVPPGDESGCSVAAAGDINGDGFADLIIGARYADPNGKTSAGSSYVIFGKSSGFATIDLASLPAADGFRIDGMGINDFSGYSVAGAGDVNGDGFADLIVGAPLADPDGKSAAGSSHVIFGKSGGFANINLALLPAVAGFRIDGAGTGDQAGHSVAAAGDVNGDGLEDLIVGARYADPNGKNAAGSSYVVFGRSSGFSNIDLAALPAAAGFRIDGAAANDFSGRSVAAAGDVNSDGFGDLIVGASYADPKGKSYAGSSYVIFGGDLSGRVTHQGSAGNDSLTGTAGTDVMIGGLGNDAISGAGGSDVIKGGGGNDLITVADAGFFRIDGGGGSDALTFFAASGLAIAAGTLRARIAGVETFDFANGQNDALALSLADVLSFDTGAVDVGGNAALDNALTIEGNAGDSLSLTGGGWALSGLTLAGYSIFANNALLVAVDNDFGSVMLS